MAERPHGARLAVDWGKARIGVAAVGAGTTLAYPVETVAAGPSALQRLLALVTEYEPAVVYVGLPLDLRGEHGPAAREVLSRAFELADVVGPGLVRLVDERMSTVAASRSLGSAGRRTRQQRRVIDQAAAVEILNRALDAEQSSGQLAGQALEELERS